MYVSESKDMVVAYRTDNDLYFEVPLVRPLGKNVGLQVSQFLEHYADRSHLPLILAAVSNVTPQGVRGTGLIKAVKDTITKLMKE